MPRHQIEHLHVQRMRRLRSPSPPPIQHQPPPLLPPFPLPAPLPFPHPPQPQRVDHTARLMQNFNSDHQRRRSRRSNHASTIHSANAHAGPVHPPSIPYQNVIDFQHEADQQAQAGTISFSLQQHSQHQRQMEQQQQQALVQRQWEHQRYLEYQRYLEHQRHLEQQRHMEQQRQAQLQREMEIQAQQEQQEQIRLQQELLHQWQLEQHQLAILQQQMKHQRQLQENQQALQELQIQEQNEIQHVQQLSQALLSHALSEHSDCSAEHFQQDQHRQQRQSSQYDSNSGSPSISSSSISRASTPDPAPNAPQSSARPPFPPSPSNPNSSDSSSSSSSDSEDSGNGNPQPAPVLHIPPGGRPYQEPIQIHSLGLMNIQCPNCHALHFISEKLSNSGVRNPRFGICCLQGQVNLPHIQQWPQNLQDLFDDPQDRTEFKKKIRQYNNALAFTSVGVDINDQAVQGSGPASFRVHGALHHLMGALMPAEEVEPSYAQLYIYDPQEANNRRVRRNPLLNPGILLDLSTTLSASHPYAEVYKQAYEIMRVSSIVFF